MPRYRRAPSPIEREDARGRIRPHLGEMDTHSLTTFLAGAVLGAVATRAVPPLRPASLLAENLFLRQQLRLYVERGVRPRITNRQRLALVVLSWFVCDWRSALIVVRPETLVRWHRNAWRLFWRWKSRPRGRPILPAEIRGLIRTMAAENPTWGEERIAHELLIKLGLQVSPRTVRKYLPRGGGGAGRGDQRWATFVRNHARAIVACDFTTVVTASFRTVYLFVAMELGSRRILHIAASDHPTADWTAQQLREALPWEHGFAYLLHDRDAIFSRRFDDVARGLGLSVVRSPVRAPKANAYVERLIGTLRRECLDFLIPFSERHLAAIVREWAEHYNRGRPHSSLGPGLPQPPPGLPAVVQEHRHRLPRGARVARRPVLGGLHHEYRLERAA